MTEGKYVVLCIDDDDDFLDSLRIILEAEGYTMKAAQSAEEGLKRYKEAKPDIILVDLMMEEIDAGTNFVKEVKALGEAPPIYMLSSVGDDLSISTDYSQLGLNGVLQKPIKPDSLLSTIRAKLN